MSRARRAPLPQLERGWSPADEESYNKGAAGEADVGTTQTAEADERVEGAPVPAAAPRTTHDSPLTPHTECLCKHVLPFVSPDTSGYKARHVDVQLAPAEAALIARLRIGLAREHAQLADGRHVETHNQTVRWLIQQVARLANVPALGS